MESIDFERHKCAHRHGESSFDSFQRHAMIEPLNATAALTRGGRMPVGMEPSLRSRRRVTPSTLAVRRDELRWEWPAVARVCARPPNAIET